jgi:hypothetical protein
VVAGREEVGVVSGGMRLDQQHSVEEVRSDMANAIHIYYGVPSPTRQIPLHHD